MRYLGIDYGQKRTGLAICDSDAAVATPLEVVHGRHRLLDRIVELVEAEAIGGIVLGLPLNMDGTKGEQVVPVERLAARIKERVDVPVYFQDERLSSFAARNRLAAARLTRKKRAGRLDAVAAAGILEDFLTVRP